MIVSKPKSSTLFSLCVFLILAYGLSLYLIINIIQNPEPPVWMAIILGIAAGAALAVTYKTITGYKTVYIGKNRVDVSYAFNLIKKRYYLKELIDWQETTIKTVSGVFKELSLHFNERKSVKITTQEHDNYGKVKAFLQKNYQRKQKK